ncbi:MAG: ABC transporter ATP-binding protein [Candidatus Bipolaricaulia bacterium]
MGVLVLEDVTAGYGAISVVQDLSMEVHGGEIVGLIGRNGVGKTTTLKGIMKLASIQQGTVAFDDVDLRNCAPHEVPHRGIAYVPQDGRVFPQLTVRHNLLVNWQPRDVLAQRWPPVLETFPSLRERLDQSAGTLSGGEQQMLAIARAFLAAPRLVVMDEPTEGLMPQLVRHVEDRTRELAEQGAGVLLAEQRLDTALALCDRLYVMDKGRIRKAVATDRADRAELERWLGARVQSPRGEAE